MKLTRKQEVQLINLGLEQVINKYFNKPIHQETKKIKHPRKRMSLAERRAISKRMKAMWRKKRNGE